MKYDDASWHYGGNFPADLPIEAGATHMALFVAWCALNGMGGEPNEVENSKALEALRARAVTPSQWFIAICDEKFTDEDLSEEGNAFAIDYYNAEAKQHSRSGCYLVDYENTFPEVPTLYGVPDTWQSYDRIAPVIARRAAKWRARRSKPFWLRLWT